MRMKPTLPSFLLIAIVLAACFDHSKELERVRSQLVDREQELRIARADNASLKIQLASTTASATEAAARVAELEGQLLRVGELHTSVPPMSASPLPRQLTPPPVYMPPDPTLTYASRYELAKPAPPTTDKGIVARCTTEWGSNFRMIEFCERQQQEALEALAARQREHPINDSVMAGISRGCIQEWKDNYRMRDFCEKQQIDAYRRISGR